MNIFPLQTMGKAEGEFFFHDLFHFYNIITIFADTT